MRILLTLLAITLVSACGGGASSTKTDNPTPSTPSTAWIRYQGLWTPSNFSSNAPIQPVTLAIAPLSGQTGISSNPVLRVDVRVGEAASVTLNSPNSTDGSGRYLFQFDRSVEPPGCTGISPNLPITIKVTDVTGFEYTKNIASCAKFGRAQDFGAFSDYGTTQAQFSYTATSPVSAAATRKSTSGYIDTLLSNALASFNAKVPSAEGDNLRFDVPAFPGVRVKALINGGGDLLAESIGIGAPVSASLVCCGPRPASVDQTTAQILVRSGDNPAETYSYRLQITDPATGKIIGTQAGTTYSTAILPIKLQRGQLIEFEITPNAPGLFVEASVNRESSGNFAYVSSNEMGTPARFKVYCCSP